MDARPIYGGNNERLPYAGRFPDGRIFARHECLRRICVNRRRFDEDGQI